MSIKSAWLAGLLVLGACAGNAQTYWSTNASLNCGTSYGDPVTGAPLKLTSGPGAGGYVCYVWGTLPWYASGGGWASSIRMSAPPTAPVQYSLFFTDVNGADVTLDYRYQGDSTVYSDTSAGSALFANQPLEVDLLGLHSQAPAYGTSANGPIAVYVECPDATTCQQVQAQLIYSALPSQPWSLSVPVVWDSQTWLGWSVVGIDDSKTNTDKTTKNTVSFVIFNLDTADTGNTSHTYTINVYDMDGNLAGHAFTPAVAQYGSYAAVLTDLVPNLPSGPFKLQAVSPNSTAWMGFEALQFHGPSATALVSASENVPGVTAAAAASMSRGSSRRLAPASRPALRPTRVQ